MLKGGEVVVEEGDVRAVTDGKEFIVQPAVDDGIEDYLRPLFEKAYTMSFANYPVEIERMKRSGRTQIILTLKEQPVVPLEAELLTPECDGRTFR